VKEVLYYQGKSAFCLLVDEATKEPIARGVAICSPKDQFVRKTGRAKARGKAQQAIVRKENIEGILAKQKIESNLYHEDWKGIEFYATFMPEMTEYEKVLVEKALAPRIPKA
jgi:hypothetical protein